MEKVIGLVPETVLRILTKIINTRTRKWQNCAITLQPSLKRISEFFFFLTDKLVPFSVEVCTFNNIRFTSFEMMIWESLKLFNNDLVTQ